ncbi:MAG: hypothetical protein RLZZ356_1049, partial [Verrucomicrobiota bacterium]
SDDPSVLNLGVSSERPDRLSVSETRAACPDHGMRCKGKASTATPRQ